MGLFLLAGPESSWMVLMPGFLVASVGSGLFNPALTNVALSSVPQDQSGVAAGVNDTFRQAGIAVGVAALGALIPSEDAFGGGTPPATSAACTTPHWSEPWSPLAGAIAGWLLISSHYGAAAEAPADEPAIVERSALRPAFEAA